MKKYYLEMHSNDYNSTMRVVNHRNLKKLSKQFGSGSFGDTLTIYSDADLTHPLSCVAWDAERKEYTYRTV